MTKMNPYRLIFTEKEKEEVNKLLESSTEHKFQFNNWTFLVNDSFFARDDSGFLFEYALSFKIKDSLLSLVKQGATLPDALCKRYGITNGILPRISSPSVRLVGGGSLHR